MPSSIERISPAQGHAKLDENKQNSGSCTYVLSFEGLEQYKTPLPYDEPALAEEIRAPVSPARHQDNAVAAADERVSFTPKKEIPDDEDDEMAAARAQENSTSSSFEETTDDDDDDDDDDEEDGQEAANDEDESNNDEENNNDDDDSV